MLKFEDQVFNIGPSFEYINPEKISRIRLTRKRIRIYLKSQLNYIYVERTEKNMKELEKVGIK